MDIEEKEKPEEQQTQLDQGTYEIIKNRLGKQGKLLSERLGKLNIARKNVFGSIETALLGSERIITKNNCIPRDIIPVNSKFIFGYNVHLGLKEHVELSDVFSMYQYRDKKFSEVNIDMISNKNFIRDFQELYKYYKDTQLTMFSLLGPYLYMVFQTGKNVSDIKAFKWLMEENKIVYVDNRSDHEVKFPPQHNFKWKRTRREEHRYGIHPHISIHDRVFVETVGGDLTIKVEDNTDSGMGIYAEDVVNKDQTLDDAETFYSIIGNLILLKIRPYQEKEFRYFVFNEKIQQVNRIDAIKDACILLPDNHGLIFSKGYYLQSGEFKTFDIELENMIFSEKIGSPNGEDYQYVFYNQESGIYLILTYNLISQSVDTPIICNGYSHFHNGEMILFKTENEPRKNHVIQIWQTPFVSADHIIEGDTDSILFKIGNQEVVQCMSECQGLINLIRKEESYANLYVDIQKETADILDTYFWLEKGEAFNIREILVQIRSAAEAAVEEFEKVLRIKKATGLQIREVKEKCESLFKDISYSRFESVDEYVSVLSQLRALRGEVISLKELRYTNLELAEGMEKSIKDKNEELSNACIGFLLQPEGLLPYQKRAREHQGKIDLVKRGVEGKDLQLEISQTSADLELLIEIVSNLKIEDPTQATEIIDRISSVYASINQSRSKLQNRLKELLKVEGEVEFNAQLKLINQGLFNFLSVADNEEKCDEYLTKLMVQIEELEGKFADFDEYIPLLAEKREEIYSAFETKKLGILEKRNKKADSLYKAGERILKGIKNRLSSFKSVNEINGYYASDIMAEKARDIIDKLLEINDNVKAEDIQSKLKTIKEDAVRQLKDKQDLFTEGEDAIRFGNHLFGVNRQKLDLTMVQRENKLLLHMIGTDFWEEVESEELMKLKAVWDQETLSENLEVYRGEYLAYTIFKQAGKGRIPSLQELNNLDMERLLQEVQKFMGTCYQEGYIKGVHDVDASLILKILLDMYRSIDLLIYSPQVRSLAKLYWRIDKSKDFKQQISNGLKSIHQVSKIFSAPQKFEHFFQLLEQEIQKFNEEFKLFDAILIPEAAEYLCREVMRGDVFIMSSEANTIYKGFLSNLSSKNIEKKFAEDTRKLGRDLAGRFYLIKQWISAHYKEAGLDFDPSFIDETGIHFTLGTSLPGKIIEVSTSKTIEGLYGNHPVINQNRYKLSYNQFINKLNNYQESEVPKYHRYQELKKSLIEGYQAKLRLDEFKPRVLTSFVRNKLIDKVYLPLIGDNLAKQIGVIGEGKRTDLMGLLLLISPPGYGKTTLMEYIANRLGVIFIKINGPAIGHQVTSLDPAEAPNAGAREEIEKLNLSFEMGNNIMIYLDDIQHCNPEFLQKFISLCDAQRKIEGIYKNRSKTYDMRGKKVSVVMAGNPYTESGEKFKIPDMLANRADVYNLGDMLRENEVAFKLSYLENALTSNPVLNQLYTKSQKDVYTLLDAAERGISDSLDLESTYSAEEIQDIINVIKKLILVRNIILKVNMEYIYSASQAEEFRTEPPFKLQGSYRNMNRIAERVLPVMNEKELNNLIEGNYENDAQTLATGAEVNMLKWKEIVGCLTEKDKNRWEQIKKDFNKHKLVQGDDKLGQAVMLMSEIGDGITGIENAISKYQLSQSNSNRNTDSIVFLKALEDLKNVLEKGFKSFVGTPKSSFTKEDLDKALSDLRSQVRTEPGETLNFKADFSENEFSVSKAEFSIIQSKDALNVIKNEKNLFDDEIHFSSFYSLIFSTLEPGNNQNTLKLIWKCIGVSNLVSPEKLLFTLVKENKSVWGYSVKFNSSNRIYRKGDLIQCKIQLRGNVFEKADHLGIRINKLDENNKWEGLKIIGSFPTNQAGKRLLMEL